MDILGAVTIPSYLLVGLVFLLSLYMYGRRKYSYFKDIGISGPSPTVFIGNLSEMRKLTFLHVYEYWRHKYGDTYGIFFGRIPALVISDPEMIGDILVKEFSNFTNRGSLQFDEISNSTITNAKDDHWKYLRTVLAPSYSSRQMREMVSLVQKSVNILEKNIEKMANSGEACDVTLMFSVYTMDVIAITGFGIEVNSQEDPNHPLVKNAREVFRVNFLNSFILIIIMFPPIAKIMMKLGMSKYILRTQIYLRNFCKKLIEERKKNQETNTRKDLLQIMLNAQLKGNESLDPEVEKELKLENMADWRTKRGMKDAEIIAQCTLFFLAGFETTASTLSFFSHSIAMNPDVQEKLYEEIRSVLGEDLPNYDNVQKLVYLDMCMDETLRMYPIAPLLNRECRNDCTINGVNFPALVAVHIPVYGLHFNPKYWPEPTKFDPERFSKEGKAKQTPFTYLPFGGGPRICAGMRLARLEFKMAVVQMLRKFRVVPVEKTENPIVFANLGMLKSKNGIWLKFERR